MPRDHVESGQRPVDPKEPIVRTTTRCPADNLHDNLNYSRLFNLTKNSLGITEITFNSFINCGKRPLNVHMNFGFYKLYRRIFNIFHELFAIIR